VHSPRGIRPQRVFVGRSASWLTDEEEPAGRPWHFDGVRFRSASCAIQHGWFRVRPETRCPSLPVSTDVLHNCLVVDPRRIALTSTGDSVFCLKGHGYGWYERCHRCELGRSKRQAPESLEAPTASYASQRRHPFSGLEDGWRQPESRAGL
jgi:hypothetical protein